MDEGGDWWCMNNGLIPAFSESSETFGSDVFSCHGTSETKS